MHIFGLLCKFGELRITIILTFEARLAVLDCLFGYRAYSCIPHTISSAHSCGEPVIGSHYVFEA